MTDVVVARAAERYSPDDKVEKNRESALRLIHQLLALEGVSPTHLKEQLKIGLWKWTEAEGIGSYSKFNTRYFSQAVVAQQPAKINHEHVWTMDNHVKSLRTRTWPLRDLEDYLRRYGVSCIVTVEEHGRLSAVKGHDGWARYGAAGVRVFDRQEHAWLDLAGSGDSPAPTSAAVAPQVPAPTVDMSELVAEHASPAAETYLVRLLRTIRLASAVAARSEKVGGGISDYFMIYDALIGESTPGVAYVHWTGRIAYRLVPEDLPRMILDDPQVVAKGRKPYGVSMRVDDDSSFELAEDLLTLALEKLRGELSAW